MIQRLPPPIISSLQASSRQRHAVTKEGADLSLLMFTILPKFLLVNAGFFFDFFPFLGASEKSLASSRRNAKDLTFLKSPSDVFWWWLTSIFTCSFMFGARKVCQKRLQWLLTLRTPNKAKENNIIILTITITIDIYIYIYNVLYMIYIYSI